MTADTEDVDYTDIVLSTRSPNWIRNFDLDLDYELEGSGH